MNAWRTNILDDVLSQPSVEFFAEALNDALVSHVLAQFGSWRSALMSLRSCIENTCYCLYYMDHPVELRLWETGRHRPGFSEIHSYLEHHPDLSLGQNNPITGLPTIKSEYGTLSRAVHASAKSFRMSPDAHSVLLWKPDVIGLKQWRLREQHTLTGLNLLLTSLFRKLLLGTQQRGLRAALANVIPTSMHSRVKSELGVTIRTI